MPSPITVYTAKRIVTMEPSLPEATAIAVRDGRIVEVGSLDSLAPWLEHHENKIDERFAGQVIMPGFIDPHVHPVMMSMLLATRWITPEAWSLPGEDIPATDGKDAFIARLTEIVAETPDDEPVLTFGFHAQYHGDILKADLDEVAPDVPIVLWQRSFHELRCNTAALEWLDAIEGAAWDPHIDLESGRMFESGMVWGLKTLTPHLLAGRQLFDNLRRVGELVRRGGVTSIADAGYGIFGIETELEAFFAAYGSETAPFRLYLMPNVLRAKGEYRDQVMERLEAHRERGRAKVQFLKSAKFFSDGAFIAQLMQLGEPGYIDGHEGAWLSEPGQLLTMVRPWWVAGYQINIHANGDIGLQSCIDTVATLQEEHPRFDHRTAIHHMGISTAAQVRRMAALGISAQFNGYYLWLFASRMAGEWLGTERASQMTRAGSVARWGSSVAVHSDLPMGPVLPLQAAQNLATRVTREGEQMGAPECLSLEQALAAVTIEAAWQLGLDHELGSLASGKCADMVVLDADPMEVGAAGLADIGIVATICGGDIHLNS